jgi:hypothetical protein
MPDLTGVFTPQQPLLPLLVEGLAVFLLLTALILPLRVNGSIDWPNTPGDSPLASFLPRAAMAPSRWFLNPAGPLAINRSVMQAPTLAASAGVTLLGNIEPVPLSQAVEARQRHLSIGTERARHVFSSDARIRHQQMRALVALFSSSR